MSVAYGDRAVVLKHRFPPASVPSGPSQRSPVAPVVSDSSNQDIHCHCPHSSRENSPLMVYTMTSSGWPYLMSSSFQKPLGLLPVLSPLAILQTKPRASCMQVLYTELQPTDPA